jgi:acetyl esterase/lipase
MKQFLLAMGITIAMNATAQQADSAAPKPVETPAGFTRQIDVVYTSGKNWEQKLDLYLPPNTGKPTPVVINIHGGGWNHGTKESQTGFNTFFKMGFAVANIEYRLTPQATAPAAVEDARCALIYLIKNAQALNIDVNKIVVMGGSAGGHLALMAGLLANDHRFDGNCPGVENIKVAAIIDKYGITDVWDWGYGKNITSKSAGRWLGDKANDATFARSVSPINYIHKDNPPVFIAHGDADPTVPYEQSMELHKKLKEVGVITEFMTIEGGKHGGFPKDKNSELNKAIVAFLQKLKISNQ